MIDFLPRTSEHPFSAGWLARVVLFLALTALSAGAPAYDAPRLDFQVVDADALLLEKREKESLVEALNAVASNFPESPLIDDDLREKALALALQLNPLNVNTRNIHRSLLAGRLPDKTPYFTESVSHVAESLWNSGQSLFKGEPEARKLSLFILELALALHPDPPIERVRQYGRASGFSEQPWKRFVSLQPAQNPSNRKLENLFQAAKEKRSAPRSGSNDPPGRTGPPQMRRPQVTPPAPPRLPPAPLSTGNAAALRLTEVQLPFIALTSGAVRVAQVAGTASLRITPATENDQPLFAVETESDLTSAAQMKLVSAPEGFPGTGFDRAEKLVRKDYPVWPLRMVATAGFDSELPVRFSRRLSQTDLSLAAGLLLECAFGGKTPDSGLVFAGRIDETDSPGEVSFSLGEDLPGILEQVRHLESEFLVVPDSQFSEMVEGAIASRQLEVLFDPQLISFSGWDELKQVAFGEDREALARAAAAFREIQKAQEKMPLVELARNEKVQERLRAIIADYPRHLSARIMLEFGKAPDDPRALIRESVRNIDGAMEPFFRLIAEISRSGVSDGAGFDEALQALEGADLALTRLRRSVVPGAREYLDTAEDFLKAAGLYLKVSNKETSLGQQRLRELQQKFGDLQTKRSEMGLEKLELDEDGPRKRMRRFPR